jgi:hypothetical protein
VELEKQKNFYDHKRYFMGKDSPGTVHPDAKQLQPVPRGQIVFGLLFLAVLALLFVLRVTSHDEHPVENPPAAASKAKP